MGDLCSDKALEIFGSQEIYDELNRVFCDIVIYLLIVIV